MYKIMLVHKCFYKMHYFILDIFLNSKSYIRRLLSPTFFKKKRVLLFFYFLLNLMPSYGHDFNLFAFSILYITTNHDLMFVPVFFLYKTLEE